MQPSRSFKRLGFLLVILIVANSSQALGIVTHDSHGHGQVVAGLDNGSGHENGISNSHHLDQSEALDSLGEDCVCAEICCVSTSIFSVIIGSEPHPAISHFTGRLPDFYTSVSLDLLLPPPNL